MLKHLRIPIVRKAVACVLAVCVCLCSALSSVPISRKGAHCPTATVQTVTQTVEKVTCCGKKVKETVTRKVTEKDPEFKQCYCTDKKAKKTDAPSSAMLNLTWVMLPCYALPQVIEFPTPLMEVRQLPSWTDWTHSPTPPPDWF